MKGDIKKQRRLRPIYWVYTKSLDAHTNEFPNVRYVDRGEYVYLTKSLLNPAALGASPPVAACLTSEEASENCIIEDSCRKLALFLAGNQRRKFSL